ncbi:hypothetical protein [Legionella shakespearei]|uniref:Uncharacterized protein n=1 Tax=Legionella shakespearei DSM 23087 TaxID=1122169 RepID=A0A0W0Z7Q9_9GAMM|nr:hypothetical protein [Legionella shakespearei]KTD65141.1 hypothetical protein Lsha_0510 [Legionella shakespearei DSM 23087]
MDEELQPEPDTILPEDLTEQMKMEGSSNDTDHNTFTRGDEVDLVGDGIPGYETTGVDGTDDQIEDEIEASMQPNPMNIP